jgi:hypothetical protein
VINHRTLSPDDRCEKKGITLFVEVNEDREEKERSGTEPVAAAGHAALKSVG